MQLSEGPASVFYIGISGMTVAFLFVKMCLRPTQGQETIIWQC